MTRRALLTGWAIVVVATVAAMLAVYGIGEEGLRVTIRTSARFSVFAVACAFAGIRTRDFLIALPISHAVHFTMIATLAFVTTPENVGADAISIPGGALLYALMIYAAVSGARWSIYALWLIFIYAIAVRMHTSWIYPPIVVMLLAAAVARSTRFRPPSFAR